LLVGCAAVTPRFGGGFGGRRDFLAVNQLPANERALPSNVVCRQAWRLFHHAKSLLHIVESAAKQAIHLFPF
jgi:hypothetical protein